MKKWISILVCLLLCVVLCACQGKPDPEESSSAVSATDGAEQNSAGITDFDEETDSTTQQGDSTATTDSNSGTPTEGSTAPYTSTTAGSNGGQTPGSTRTAGSTAQNGASSTRPSATGTTTAGENTPSKENSTVTTHKSESSTSKNNKTTQKADTTAGKTSGTSATEAPAQSSTTAPSQSSPSTAPSQPDLDMELPAVGYDLDGKGRILLKSTVVSGNTVTFVFENKSKSFMPSEDATLAYTLYDGDGKVLQTDTMHIGMINCGKEKTVTLTLPADTASLVFGTFTVSEYWSDWK